MTRAAKVNPAATSPQLPITGRAMAKTHSGKKSPPIERKPADCGTASQKAVRPFSVFACPNQEARTPQTRQFFRDTKSCWEKGGDRRPRTFRHGAESLLQGGLVVVTGAEQRHRQAPLRVGADRRHQHAPHSVDDLRPRPVHPAKTKKVGREGGREGGGREALMSARTAFGIYMASPHSVRLHHPWLPTGLGVVPCPRPFET